MPSTTSTLQRPATESLFNELCAVIPGGVDSPVRSCKAMQQLPMIAASAREDIIEDVDGISYIDYCGSWGALIHGHANPEILKAIQKRMKLGTTFGITTAIEGELATKIIDLMPAIEKIRFVSSGTEATMSAIRLARGFTRRDVVIKFSGNYHGHADFFLVQAGSGVFGLSSTSSSAGIPEDIVKHTISLPYNDIDTCRSVLHEARLRDRIAAVIIEPIAGNMGVVPATKEFLQMLREETKKIGALLVLDEVITGFRVGLGGAQQLYDIEPDLTCLGKIMGGGLPAAAFGGRRDIMDFLAPLGPVYQAGTLSGNPLAMEAGLQALQMLQRKGFYEELENKTKMLIEPIKEALHRKKALACVQHVGSMFTLFFGRHFVENMEDAHLLDTHLYAKFFRYLFENGVYIPPSQHEAWFISSAHTEDHLLLTRDLILNFIKTHV